MSALNGVSSPSQELVGFDLNIASPKVEKSALQTAQVGEKIIKANSPAQQPSEEFMALFAQCWNKDDPTPRPKEIAALEKKEDATKPQAQPEHSQPAAPAKQKKTSSRRYTFERSPDKPAALSKSSGVISPRSHLAYLGVKSDGANPKQAGN